MAWTEMQTEQHSMVIFKSQSLKPSEAFRSSLIFNNQSDPWQQPRPCCADVPALRGDARGFAHTEIDLCLRPGPASWGSEHQGGDGQPCSVASALKIVDHVKAPQGTA